MIGWRVALRDAVLAFVASRALIAAALGLEDGALHDSWHRWDAGWYGDIAARGYVRGYGGAFDDGAPAFFPGLPWLERTLGVRLGIDPELAGAAIASVCSLLALILLHRLAQRRLGPAEARLAVWAVCLFPFSFVLSIGYTEGPYLLATLLAFAAVERARTAGIAGAFVASLAAALLRPPGVLLAPALIFGAWRDGGRRLGAALAGAIGAVAGPALYLAYLERERGDWRDAFDAQELIWDRRSGVVGAPAALAEYTWQAVTWPRLTFLVYLVGVPLAVTGLVILWRRGIRDGMFAFALLSALAPLSTGSAMSLPRFLLGTFPFALAAGAGLAALPPRWRIVALGLSACGLVACLWGAYWAAELPP